MIDKSIRLLLIPVILTIVAGEAIGQDRVRLPSENGGVELRGGFLDSDGVKLHYYTLGTGPLLVLLHGADGSWSDWRYQIVALAARYQVVALDGRGFNYSDKPVGVEQYTTAKTVGDVNAVLEHFNQDKAIVVGHDLGGMTAWSFAMAYPEKTAQLIVVDAFHPRSLLRYLALENPNSPRYRSFFEDPDVVAKTQQSLLSSQVRPYRNAEAAKLREDVGRRSSAEAVVAWYRANFPPYPYSKESKGWGSQGDDFPMVKVPVLVFHGVTVSKDRVTGFFPSGLNDLFKYIERDLTVVTMQSVGHWGPEEAPEFISRRMLDWLAQQRDAPLAVGAK